MPVSCSRSPFRFLRALPLLALATFAAAGGSLIPEASPSLVERATQRWADVNLEQLEQGRNVYVKRCSGCHNLHLPSEKSPEQWAAALDEMAVKGRLDESQKAAVLRYLSAASAELRQVSLAPAAAPAMVPAATPGMEPVVAAPAIAATPAPAAPVAAQNPAQEPALPGGEKIQEPK